MKSINIWAAVSLLLLFSCGGSLKEVKGRPHSITLVPFAADNLAGNLQDLNRKLLHALNASGRFRVQTLGEAPALLNLTDMPSADSSGRYLLTGQFLSENLTENPGKHIPFVAYLPKVVFSVVAEMRLYDAQNKNWLFIQRVKGESSRKGDVQLLDYDTSDPSLAVSGKDRLLLRNEAYDRLFYNMVKLLEKAMEIKK